MQEGCPVPTGVPSSALPVADASSQDGGWLSLCGPQYVSHALLAKARPAAGVWMGQHGAQHHARTWLALQRWPHALCLPLALPLTFFSLCPQCLR